MLCTTNDAVDPLVVTPQDEWLIFTMPQAPSFRIAITLCFDSFISLNADTSQTAVDPSKEPGFTWDASAQVAGIEDLRRQIGVLDPASNSQDQPSRGLMTLLTSPADLRSQLNGSVQATSNPGPPPTPVSAQEFLKMHIRDKVMWGGTLGTRCKLPADDPVSATRYMDTGGITQEASQESSKTLATCHLHTRAISS